ncbi:hypothetical protein [Leptolyngbya sp. FACHB-261]|uniref:hypothetical protein n=1 Tax=Leptolyngbya sp. FACHB-261 TaxID=2692806 RepID=UPI001686BC24|nr:hypothetical protein [Leptolyngbya sp. FACHB-261]MBD2104049.1 hypothetical protein [Leptolyngbya sp. FACHB-261]
MLPVVVSEDAIDPFNISGGTVIAQGMYFASTPYQLVSVFSSTKKLLAHALGCRLLRKGLKVVISESENHYRVWADRQALVQLKCNPQSQDAICQELSRSGF